jgi:hypothetical protein
MFKQYCSNCNQNKEVGHFCYTQPAKNEYPRSDDVLFVFYDFQTTHDTMFSDKANVHVPILVCLQQFCTVERRKTISMWIVSAVVGDAILSSRTLSETCYIFSNFDHGVKRL